jgi:hypothetical protein
MHVAIVTYKILLKAFYFQPAHAKQNANLAKELFAGSQMVLAISNLFSYILSFWISVLHS